ncbi:hypothetical protein GCM10023264_21340 [Sphingomonas daechungensis]|uniref:DUF202 domain-containing protein n=1 Tax=Sphingomonas daechungensis TaxID=1176646 RepID=A0ABX6T1X4_9SPHN|nr:DUF202 domain-containing protein [Sphingomonas daechungensis]QNP43765.1 DUF202 domain-containing protein [Sphingomonas daechungensis]
MAHTPKPLESLIGGDNGTELAAQRTAMSFDRTALASDRTLMAGVRTSFALIGFGFTIFQFLHTLNDRFVNGSIPAGAPQRFGLTLISLGVILLVLAILSHRSQTRVRRLRREQLVERGLIRSVEDNSVNGAMVIAILLLVTGLLALLRVAASIGPF